MSGTAATFEAKTAGASAMHAGGSLYETMRDRARALAPVLRSRAADTENLRHLPPDTARGLHEAGLFRILQPRRVGGSEFDFVALVDFGAELARGDASAGWTFANLASHHWMLGMFEAEAQDRVWTGNADALIASSFVFSEGHATPANGGFRLSGRWPFASGVELSDWIMLGGFVMSSDGADYSEYRIFLIHKTSYSIIDTWNASGLRGTGSHDVAVHDVFVPSNMTLSLASLTGGAAPGSAINPGPLYKLPVFGLIPFVLTGVALGNAQGCLDDYIRSAGIRASKYTLAKLADFQSTQIKIGEASAKIDAAGQIVRGTCTQAMADAARGAFPDMLAQTRQRRDAAFAVKLCTEAVTLLFAASGAGALYTSNAIQRQFRDAHAINAHIAFNFDAAGGNYGRAALGFPFENVTL